MSKRVWILIAALLVIVSAMSVVLAGCGKSGGNSGSDDPPAASGPYVIQYTDDQGTHTITVENGKPYYIETIPQRNGYEFIGLFDAQVGGTQYVAANGSSIAPFTDNKNIVLFPQFRAKQYKVVLDYGEAPVTGAREIVVDYDSELPELPVDLAVANKDFLGWYTEPDCKGVQIADKYGVLPDRRAVTEQNFDLSDANGFIYLYAGFRGAMRTVTFYVGDGYTPIEMQVEHGTLIDDIVPDYRTEEGFAVYEWTLSSDPSEDSTVFRGAIERDIVLYAKTYAPVIELDPDGGENMLPIVQQAGENVTLLTPVKENYKFLYWADENGEEAVYTTMPSESVSLTAMWQAMLIFDENGGVEVDDISQAANTTVILPTPERDGYVFAGWYTAGGEKYESTSMPAVSEVLKAGWYVEKETIVNLKGANDTTKYPSMWSDFTYVVDFDEYFPSGEEFNVVIDWHAEIKYGNMSSVLPVHVDFYSRKVVSSAYLLETKTFDGMTDTYKTIEFTTTFTVSDDLYICWYADENLSTLGYMLISDFYYTIHYPDTSVMY